ncbi:MAG: hydantoinase/oxoprolinase family protein [Candidatus Rokubacteria bacterium]|nr:hydantoinase/oxoprolinase family protein [Candidatus Rokubacteria bacterium]
MSRFRVGVDIGGTFTDIVLLGDDGATKTRKVPSSVDNYARAIVEGMQELLGDPDLSRARLIVEHVQELMATAALRGPEIGEIVHGTTVGANAILERKGAKTGLITTRGFRDVLEIRRLRMPRLYDLTWEKPPPLVERHLRMEVDERINARGDVLRPLDVADVERALDRLLREGIEVLAVCLINAYANPVHEEAITAIARRRAPHLPVSTSADILPELREYERTSTTVINGYVMPVVRRYLRTLREGLDGIGIPAPLLIMQSNGGLMSAEAAARLPMHIIESGPAAGVVGTQALARRLELPKVISFDMGGTTAKASIVEDGEVHRTGEIQVGGGLNVGSRLLTGAGYLLRVPAIDLAEVGAGGGSIVWIDAGGALQVGPRSAGALPGPVCYDLGGTEPTITDTNVVLGYLNPAQLAGGAVKLDAARAHEVLEERIARPLGLSLAEAAHGAYLIATSNMLRAIKAVSSERGRDPREYVLVAFGGNGPLFATALARALEIRRIVVPPAPGLFSAFGLLYAEVEHHYVRTYRRAARRIDLDELNGAWRQMEADALAQLTADGFGGAAAELRRSADLRYHGQSFELTVPVPAGPLDAAAIAALEDAFGREHERTYGHRAGPAEPVELVALRLVAHGIPDRPRIPDRIQADREPGTEPPAERRAYFGPDRGWLRTPVLPRAALGGGRPGPFIVEEYDATCVVPPAARAALDEHGNIVIDIEPEPPGRR